MNTDRRFYSTLFLVVALIAAEVYLYTGIRELAGAADRIRTDVVGQVSGLRGDKARQDSADRGYLDRIARDLNATKRESLLAANLSGFQIQVRAEQLHANLSNTQRRRRDAFEREVAGLRAAAAETSRRADELAAEQRAVRQEAAEVRAEADGADADAGRERVRAADVLDAAQDQRDEIAAAAGAEPRGREHIDFTLPAKQPSDVAGLRLALRDTDPARNLFSLDITAAGKTITEKDRSANEPVRLALDASHQPYEIVVNQVAKDRISGYLLAPAPEMTARK